MQGATSSQPAPASGLRARRGPTPPSAAAWLLMFTQCSLRSSSPIMDRGCTPCGRDPERTDRACTYDGRDPERMDRACAPCGRDPERADRACTCDGRDPERLDRVCRPCTRVSHGQDRTCTPCRRDQQRAQSRLHAYERDPGGAERVRRVCRAVPGGAETRPPRVQGGSGRCGTRSPRVQGGSGRCGTRSLHVQRRSGSIRNASAPGARAISPRAYPVCTACNRERLAIASWCSSDHGRKGGGALVSDTRNANRATAFVGPWAQRRRRSRVGHAEREPRHRVRRTMGAKAAALSCRTRGTRTAPPRSSDPWAQRRRRLAGWAPAAPAGRRPASGGRRVTPCVVTRDRVRALATTVGCPAVSSWSCVTGRARWPEAEDGRGGPRRDSRRRAFSSCDHRPRAPRTPPRQPPPCVVHVVTSRASAPRQPPPRVLLV
jgi:hypothetical protein